MIEVGGSEQLTSDSLPMVVWLKGDEDYFEDFALDAHQVMEELGIKRSRLRQISGEELRVGRVKSGRYIKPIYRSQDVESYKNWTRATASHSKSSTVVEKALESLKSESTSLIDTLTEESKTFRQQLDSVSKRLRDEILGISLNQSLVHYRKQKIESEHQFEYLNHQLQNILNEAYEEKLTLQVLNKKLMELDGIKLSQIELMQKLQELKPVVQENSKNIEKMNEGYLAIVEKLLNQLQSIQMKLDRTQHQKSAKPKCLTPYIEFTNIKSIQKAVSSSKRKKTLKYRLFT